MHYSFRSPTGPLFLQNKSVEWHGLVSLIFDGLLFCIIAHEYSHLLLGHVERNIIDAETRFRIEHSADMMAVLLALRDPWNIALSDTTTKLLPTLTGACFVLLLSFLKMLERGDQILERLGHVATASTHPPSQVRLDAIAAVVESTLDDNRPAWTVFDEFATGFLSFGESLWVRASSEVFTRLQGEVTRPSNVSTPPSLEGATLKFL